MLSDTLNAGLEGYRIGPEIRSLRLAKGLSLVELGEHTGLSAGMLSKIERGQIYPTLPTLLRIAMVFDVGLDHFFAGEAERPVLSVVRKADRIQLPNDAKGRESYRFESLDFPVTERALSTYLAEFPPRAPASEPHSHGDMEVLFVIEGTLEFAFAEQTVVLEEGDAVHFDARVDHGYRGVGSKHCRAIVAVAPVRRG